MEYVELNDIFVLSFEPFVLVLRNEDFVEGIRLQLTGKSELAVQEAILRRNSIREGEVEEEKVKEVLGLMENINVCRIYYTEEDFRSRLSRVEGELSEENIFKGQKETLDIFMYELSTAISMDLKIVIDKKSYEKILKEDFIYEMESTRLSKEHYVDLNLEELGEDLEMSLKLKEYLDAEDAKNEIKERTRPYWHQIIVLILINETQKIPKLLSNFETKTLITCTLNIISEQLVEAKYRTSLELKTEDAKEMAARKKLYTFLMEAIREEQDYVLCLWKECLTEFRKIWFND